MAKYEYRIFIPGGNKTALVFGIDGLEDNLDARKRIQEKIMLAHKHDADGEVEQVGFVSMNKSTPRLLMTGGEFCGNATRTAAAFYLNGREGTVEIAVSGADKPLSAGIDRSGMVWSQMPVHRNLASAIIPVKGGLYWVMMEGISHLIVPQLQSAPYLNKIFQCADSDEQKRIAFGLLEKSIAGDALPHDDCYGVMFLENVADLLKMHPFVHVGAAGTTYYETGCGSGAICVGLVSSMLRGESVQIALLQPSGKVINAEITHNSDNTVTGKISGIVEQGNTGEVEV